MSSAALRAYAQEYFSSINSIAERIRADVNTAVTAYEDLWHTLSPEDQNQVLDDTIIHPEAVLKYSLCQQNEIEIECFPRLRLETGYKYVTDDDGGKEQAVKWRDEHSAPFTWMTQSQLNLSIMDSTEKDSRKPPLQSSDTLFTPSKKPFTTSDGFVDPPDVVLGGSSSRLAASLSPKINLATKNPCGEDSLLTKLKNKTAVLKIQTTLKSTMGKPEPERVPCQSDNDKQALVHTKTIRSTSNNLKNTKNLGNKPLVSKPKTPPPPPPTKQKHISETKLEEDPERKALLPGAPTSGQNSKETKEHLVVKSTTSIDSIDLDDFRINLNSPSKDVPKTGFDFLDNW
ncbi:uncharacterized protein C1orf198 homolog isoform X1 [Schistocerca serialis cubense]|uniref:uncharacterized protein C1orf198 homolog isoform X1 n=1 Tax=Schistocerca serialis cubense TaxID=2023355 RepID=UPI00214E9D43|nr:uncharacterized protein C1orf198 homolog isoform X1 [Schistocerca serialis cubense]